ncbi:hypothetical protein [Mucilaginibacter sp.]|uniref:hypothetical protein n=1 Tax=Mucilaginibacter sp. TaxID=1882438 RepID=UPI0035BC5C7A
MSSAKNNIPAQVEGQQTDISHFVNVASREDAHHLFLVAKGRLKDISQWHIYAGPLSAKFAITDARGNDVYKFAQPGDLFSIDLPGPGPLAGDGFEWVRIEAMDEVTNKEADNEYITMKVRPIANPKHPDKAVAHFYDHSATSTFVVERNLNRVSASVHGRNETANTSDTGLFDTVRNTIIALSAREGLSLPQWKALMKGLLEE